MSTVKNTKIPIINMPGKLCFIDKTFRQFTSKDEKQIMLMKREDILPGRIYEKPIQYSFLLGDSVNGELESVESLSEALAVAWLLSEGYTFADFK
ncbi:MAG: hypothetical protein RBS07_09755 [Lentimicrobium sp.]|jgi:hypothetical protein|nr:hypothetical protein [Lentimicrobium sp.]